MDDSQLRSDIIMHCRAMNASGLNRGTSGNISARSAEAMLITPSATPYDALEPAMIARMRLDAETGAADGPLKPSSEWRFHRDILRARPEVGAIVHAHSTYATTLAIARRPIPPCHYMIAAFGGDDVRVADYALFGTQLLSDHVMRALEGRTACLLANHGMIALGATLAQAMWRAVELEAIARQFYLSLCIGGPVLLSAREIAAAHDAFAGYGLPSPAATHG